MTTLKVTTMLLLGLLLVACAQVEEMPNETGIVCDPPYILTDSDCCLDENGNGICDDAETPEQPVEAPEIVEPTVEEPVIETEEPAFEEPTVNETEPEVEETEEPEELTLAEENLKIFDEKVKYYVTAYDDPLYDQMYLWYLGDYNKYIMKEWYGEIKSGKLVLSKYSVGIESDRPELKDEIKDGNVSVMEYIWDDGTLSGCIITGGYYIKKNCIYDLKREEQVINTGFKWNDKPRMPHEWWNDFTDRKPVEIRLGRTYKDEFSTHTVDHVYYDNDDGTQTLLYVHQGYKIPLKVEILKDKKPIKKWEYYWLEVNSPYQNTWGSDFMTI